MDVRERFKGLARALIIGLCVALRREDFAEEEARKSVGSRNLGRETTSEMGDGKGGTRYTGNRHGYNKQRGTDNGECSEAGDNGGGAGGS